MAIAVALVVAGVAACGDDDRDEPEFRDADSTVPCVDDDPGKAATYVNRDVAIGHDPQARGSRPPSSTMREAVLVHSTSDCPEDWTAYPGGLAFRGRHCVRLRVEGPGDARGTALVGLRRDCSA